MKKISRAIEADIQTKIIPVCLYWNIEEVARWIEDIGFPRYSSCFRKNFVNGRKLIAIDCSALPTMGIHSFDDMKTITKAIREMLGIAKVNKRESALTDPKYAYLEFKRRSGIQTDNVTYKEFVRRNRFFFPESARNLSNKQLFISK